MASKVTLRTLEMLRTRSEPAVFVTAYDYPTAVFAERAAVDMILIGDSAAMTMLGLPNTLGISLDEMLVFARAVCRAVTRAFVVADLPFMSYQQSDEAAVLSAGRFIALGCDAVKCEGGERIASRVRAMTNAGMCVMGHLGLTPQSITQLGGYRVQGKSRAAADRVLDDALALQEAGASSLLLEAMPPESAAYVRERLDIPVYGIGAGPYLDGQLVISHDILGNFVGDIAPKFVSRYAELGNVITDAFERYARDVRQRTFPGPEHWYHLEPAAVADFDSTVATTAAA